MFTGIVQGTGQIAEVIEGETIKTFKIEIKNKRFCHLICHANDAVKPF